MITDPETIKVLSDALRIRILDVLQRLQVASATTLAEELGESAPKISYHLKQMEKHEIVYLAETRTKGNLIENLYAPTAEQFMIQRDLSAPNNAEFSEAIMQTMRELNAMMSADLLRLPYIKESLNFPSSVSYGSYYLTKEDVEDLRSLVEARMLGFSKKPGPGLFACSIGFQLIDIASLPEGRDER